VVNLVKRDDGFAGFWKSCARRRHALISRSSRGSWPGGRARINESVLKPVNCPQEMADALLHSEEALTVLCSRVQGLINCPVVREVNGHRRWPGAAMRRHATADHGGEMPPVVELNKAVPALLEFAGGI